MKKRITSIFLTIILIMALTGTSIFTSCKEDSGSGKQEVALSQAIKTDHSDELGEIIMTISSNSGNATSSEITKNDWTTLIKGLADKYKSFLDTLGQKVLYSAGITNAKISASLVAVNDFLNNYYSFTKYFSELSVKYENTDIFTDDSVIPEPPVYDETLPNAEETYFSNLKDYIKGIYGVIDTTKIATVVNTFTQQDKKEFLEKYNLYNASIVKFIKTISFKDIVGAITNFVFCYDQFGISYSANTISKIEKIKTSFTELGINDSEKRVAYAELAGFALDEYKKISILEASVNAEDLINLINSVSKLQDATTSEKTTIVVEIRDLLYSIAVSEGNTIIGMGEDTLSLVEQLKKSANLLNKNGVGYFVERFLPLYANSQIFTGTFLKSLNKSDMLALLNCTSNGLISDKLKNSEDLTRYISVGDEGLYTIMEIFCHNLQNTLNNLSDKNAFINSIDVAMCDGGENSSYFLKQVEKMNGYYNDYYAKNIGFDKLTEKEQNDLKQTYIDLLSSAEGFNIALEGMDSAIQSVKEYIQPIMDILGDFYLTK